MNAVTDPLCSLENTFFLHIIGPIETQAKTENFCLEFPLRMSKGLFRVPRGILRISIDGDDRMGGQKSKPQKLTYFQKG